MIFSNDGFFYSGRLDFTTDFQYRKLHFPVIDVDIWAEFLANIISHAHPHAAGYSEPPGQTTKTCNDRNDKNDSKDNSKDGRNTDPIRDDTPVRTFLFSIGFILANGRRNHKRQNQNGFYLHFVWQTFSVFLRF